MAGDDLVQGDARPCRMWRDRLNDKMEKKRGEAGARAHARAETCTPGPVGVMRPLLCA